MSDVDVRIYRHPTQEDWARCKYLALATMGKAYGGDGSEITVEWKRRMLKAEHSPIRTLMFTITVTVPSYVSTHLVRHKFGVEHYVMSQRNDRQSAYDRREAPQDAPVTHVLDVNAPELIQIAHMRLCNQADEKTREVVGAVCDAVVAANPEFFTLLVPKCAYLRGCNELKPCGRETYWDDLVDRARAMGVVAR